MSHPRTLHHSMERARKRGFSSIRTRMGGFFAAFMTGCMIFTVVGCTKGCGSPNATGIARQNSVLKIQLTSDPVTVDPSMSEDVLAMSIIHNTMDGLVGYDSTGKLVAQLAESWKISKDGLRYEFTLRPGAMWSDGTPVQAVDFVTSFRRVLSPRTGGKLASLLLMIRGAKAYHLGPGKPGGSNDLPGVYEQGGKLVIELERPVSYLLDALTLGCAVPLRQDILKDNQGDWPAVAPSTGAYHIVAYQPGRRFLLDRNEYYWGKRPAMPLVDLKIIPDESEAVSLFEKGGVDVLTRISVSDLPRLEQKGLVVRQPLLATDFLAFNTRKPPASDLELRRAVAGVIRKSEIVKALGMGDIVADSWIPPELGGHAPRANPSPTLAAAVARVRRRLASSGQKIFPLLASFSSSDQNALIMDKVQKEVQSGLGISILLSDMDWKSYISMLETDPSMIYQLSWLAPFRDPVAYLELFKTGNPGNFTGWSNPAYDRLVDKIAAVSDGPDRAKAIDQAESMIEDAVVVIPLFHNVQNLAVSQRLQGVRSNPFETIRFDEISLKAPSPRGS